MSKNIILFFSQMKLLRLKKYFAEPIILLLGSLILTGFGPNFIDKWLGLSPVEDKTYNFDMVKSLTLDKPSAITIKNGICYIGSSNGVYFVNISDVSSPKIITKYKTPSEVVDLEVAGKILYLVDHEVGLRILDVSDTLSPKEIGLYLTTGKANKVFITDKFIYLVDYADEFATYKDPREAKDFIKLAGVFPSGGGGLYILDVSNPKLPKKVNSTTTPGSAESIFVAGRLAYVADGNWGLRIFDVGEVDSNITIVNKDIPSFSRVWDVVIKDNLAFITNRDNFQILNISNPKSPKTVSSFKTPGLSRKMFLNNNFAYIGEFGGLRVLDISDVNLPKELAYFKTSGYTSDVFVENGYVFVTDSKAGLIILKPSFH